MRARQKAVAIGRIYLVLCVLISTFPIYWMINTSFKTDYEIYSKTPTLFPHVFSLDAYRYLLTETNFLSSMKNSRFNETAVSFCAAGPTGCFYKTAFSTGSSAFAMQ